MLRSLGAGRFPALTSLIPGLPLVGISLGSLAHQKQQHIQITIHKTNHIRDRLSITVLLITIDF